MKPIIIVMIALLVLLQYKLWMSDDGVRESWHRRKMVDKQQQVNTEFHEKNAMRLAEIQGLKKGAEAIEERARQDLGMVKDGEVYYQVVEHRENT